MARQSTKWWHLKDPQGVEYKHQGGISIFVKEHKELFDPEDLISRKKGGKPAAYSGLEMLRPDVAKAHSWKGWTWNWAKKYVTPPVQLQQSRGRQ